MCLYLYLWCSVVTKHNFVPGNKWAASHFGLHQPQIHWRNKEKMGETSVPMCSSMVCGRKYWTPLYHWTFLEVGCSSMPNLNCIKLLWFCTIPYLASLKPLIHRFFKMHLILPSPADFTIALLMTLPSLFRSPTPPPKQLGNASEALLHVLQVRIVTTVSFYLLYYWFFSLTKKSNLEEFNVVKTFLCHQL